MNRSSFKNFSPSLSLEYTVNNRATEILINFIYDSDNPLKMVTQESDTNIFPRLFTVLVISAPSFKPFLSLADLTVYFVKIEAAPERTTEPQRINLAFSCPNETIKLFSAEFTRI